MIPHRFCVCVPARNEADRLPVLLDALARQDVAGPIVVALCINNSDDGSVAAIARAGGAWPDRLTLDVSDHRLAQPVAHAGTARGLAMDQGLRLIDPDKGVLISTDADCRPPPTWIAATLAAMDAGAGMVGGRILLDESEAIPPHIWRMRALLDDYWQRVRQIEDAIDPCDWDPAPRHGDHTGASLAITAPLYRAIGGVPPIASGEDRAMVANGCAAGGRLAHPMTVWTRTSARSVGRATGGMADEMARLEVLAAAGAPPLLPSFDRWRERAAWRRARRALPDGGAAMAREEAALPPMPCDMALAPAG